MPSFDSPANASDGDKIPVSSSTTTPDSKIKSGASERKRQPQKQRDHQPQRELRLA